jgi:hypothetical protein
MNRREAKREAQRIQSDREELVERMARILPEDGSFEAFDGFFLARSSKPMESVHSLYQPAFCFVVQGGKRVLLGEEVFWYDPWHYLELVAKLNRLRVKARSKLNFATSSRSSCRSSSRWKKRRKNDLISVSG